VFVVVSVQSRCVYPALIVSCSQWLRCRVVVLPVAAVVGGLPGQDGGEC